MLIRDRLRAVAPLRKWLLEKGMLAPSPALGVLQSDFRESCGQSMDRLRRLLQAADGACRLAGARFVVLLLPAREQVYPEDLQRAIEYNGSRADPAAIDSDAPNQALREALADSGVELVDVLDWLRSHREPERLFFPRYDPHLTPAGHLAVAEALSSKLTGRQPQSNPE
jgi:hypothetical protein